MAAVCDIYDGLKGVTRQADGYDGTKKAHLCGRVAVRVPLLMHHGAGGRKQSLCGGADTCWTVRTGSSAEVESPGGCA